MPRSAPRRRLRLGCHQSRSRTSSDTPRSTTVTDEKPESFSDVVRRRLRPPPGRLARRLFAEWGVEVGDDTDQTDADNQPPPPAAA